MPPHHSKLRQSPQLAYVSDGKEQDNERGVVPGDHGGRPLLIRVVRVGEHESGNWLLGCEFAHQLNDDDLRALLR